MSFSLKVEDKDIALRGSQLAITHGSDKLRQDLSLWLTERFRSDRFHVSYGSILDNFIGQTMEYETTVLVESEVMRVLQNYQSLQYRRMMEDSSKMSPSEILVSVLSVRARVLYDAVLVTIRFTTAARQGEQLTVGASLN